MDIHPTHAEVDGGFVLGRLGSLDHLPRRFGHRFLIGYQIVEIVPGMFARAASDQRDWFLTLTFQTANEVTRLTRDFPPIFESNSQSTTNTEEELAI